MTTVETRSGTRAGASWWVIAKQELVDLWFSSKGLSVLFGFTLLLSALSYLASADAGINLLDARESVGVVVQVSIALGTLAALVVSADAISGERERGTLESLLVTPVARRNIVIGKLVAATSMWVAALIVALPFVAVMADGPGVTSEAILVLLIGGGLVAAALTALGLAVSSISMSNRTSLAASIAILLMLAAPSQLPSIASNGTVGAILVKANPVSSGLKLANNVLVRQQSWPDNWTFLLSPLIAAVVLTAIAIALSHRLELGGAR